MSQRYVLRKPAGQVQESIPFEGSIFTGSDAGEYDLAPEMDGTFMTVKQRLSRPPVATIVRAQLARQEFRKAVQSSEPSPADKEMSSQFVDLLQRLDKAEKCKR